MGKSDKRVRVIIEDELRWMLKKVAADRHTTMQELVNEAIKKYLMEGKH
jgi:hypothetical protein